MLPCVETREISLEELYEEAAQYVKKEELGILVVEPIEMKTRKRRKLK